jgi:hypothetical protein
MIAFFVSLNVVCRMAFGLVILIGVLRGFYPTAELTTVSVSRGC